MATFRKQRLHPAVGHASLVDQLHEFEAAERRCHSRLDDDRAAGCYGGCDLVHDQIERMVEGRDLRHHADRLLDCPGATILARVREAHGYLDAAPRAPEGSRVAYAGDRPGGLD